jgi:hypothetical protein
MDGAEALRSYAWNLLYAHALVRDLPAGQWTAPGGPGLENHPAWTLGHLCTGANLLAQDLGLPDDLPDGWTELFQRCGPGDPRLPAPDPAAYPSRDEVLSELRRQHERVDAAWRATPPSRWAESEDWAFGRDLPSRADAALFMAVTHEALHLGQLAAWRRAHGLPSALRALAVERSA